MKQLVFVHGRAQEHKDSVALKAEWISAWREGLAESGLTVPIPESDIRFPYYGQTLFDLVADVPLDEAAQVIVRGSEADAEARDFLRAVLTEIQAKHGISDEEVEAILETAVRERGPQNWEWVQGLLRAIDRKVPGASGASIAIATNDVYQYLRNPAITAAIEQGVAKAVAPDVPTVVVGHSLGTVVAYKLLQRGLAERWKVPLYVSLGSPLGVSAIRRALRPISHPACAVKWFNAMDQRDVVALYPLDKRSFDIDPEIENKIDVDNQTPNRHGITGYLSDKEVARRIHEALA